VRILYHHRTLADGAEGIHIAAMVDAFRALGHEVLVTTVTAAPASAQPRAALVGRVRSLLPSFAFEAASMAVNLPEYLQVRREMERFRPDLLYKRHARYDLAALAAARRAGIPAVLEVNSLFSARDYERFEPLVMLRLARAAERRALQLATVVLTVSTPLARQARALADAANIVVIPNGADPGAFDPRIADGLRVRTLHGIGAALTIGWTGILREWHGLELLLDAVVPLAPAMLLIVGDGPARPALEQRIAALGLQERVIFTGRVRHEDVRDYIAAMDVAVVADERTGIASPMKLLEYMSMARPVIAPRADNIRDLIDDGRDGLLFAAGDAGDLSARLQELASDESRRRALGSNARQKVVDQRNWRRIAQEVLMAVRLKPDTTCL
jgi:glycosyltransferase involved in cell wall biosynthesis